MRTLLDTTAYLAAAGSYKLTQWVVRSLSDLLYVHEERPDILKQLSIIRLPQAERWCPVRDCSGPLC